MSAPNGSVALPERVALQYEIEQALYAEARLLDARRYREWLEFLTDDVVYWIPIRNVRCAGESEHEFTAYGEPAFYDENRRLLEARVLKLESGWAWAEDPPSRTRHHLSNVVIVETTPAGEVVSECGLLLYRSRLDTDVDVFSARRVDTLRRVESAWKLARREVYLDSAVLMAKNLGVFF